MILVKHFAYAKVKTFETDEMSLCESWMVQRYIHVPLARVSLARVRREFNV